MSVAICSPYAAGDRTRSAILLADTLSLLGHDVSVYSTDSTMPQGHGRWDAAVRPLRDSCASRLLQGKTLAVWFDWHSAMLSAPENCCQVAVVAAVGPRQLEKMPAQKLAAAICGSMADATVAYSFELPPLFVPWALPTSPRISSSSQSLLGVSLPARVLNDCGVFLPAILLSLLLEFPSLRVCVMLSGRPSSGTKAIWQAYLGSTDRLRFVRNPTIADRRRLIDSCRWCLCLDDGPVAGVDVLEALWAGVSVIVPDVPLYSDLVYQGFNGFRAAVLPELAPIKVSDSRLLSLLRHAIGTTDDERPPSHHFLDNRRRAFIASCARLVDLSESRSHVR